MNSSFRFSVKENATQDGFLPPPAACVPWGAMREKARAAGLDAAAGAGPFPSRWLWRYRTANSYATLLAWVGLLSSRFSFYRFQSAPGLRT